MEDFYLKNKHTATTTTLTVDTFYINDVQVCMSWYGCNKHKREACRFLMERKFGTVLVCGYTGNDIDQIENGITPVPEDCPLNKLEKPNE